MIPEDWQDQPDAYDAQGVDLTLIRHLLAMTYFAMSRLHSQVVRANASHLSAQGHVLLKTRYGNLDLLGKTATIAPCLNIRLKPSWMVFVSDFWISLP